MNLDYGRIKTPAGPAFVRRGIEEAANVDSIVFDCDGVLVDARNSYDRVALHTLDRLMGDLFGIRMDWEKGIFDLIQTLRMTGGFNNDWDTTYALSLLATVSLPDGRRTMAKNPGNLPPREIGRVASLRVIERMAKLAGDYSVSGELPGRESVAWFVRTSSSDCDKLLCDRVREYEGYPGAPPSSLLATLFDETYHGPALYRQLYGVKARYHKGSGYIEDDELLVQEEDIITLSQMMSGRLALATGRPRLAAEYSLGGLISYFKPDASVFIGDADRGLDYRGLKAFRKPSGLSLVRAGEEFNSENLLYVGDSAEDLQMVRNARQSRDGILFAGVYGSTNSPADRRKFFMENGAEFVLPGVPGLAGLLRSVRD